MATLLQPLFDEAWLVAVEREIAAIPDTIGDVTDAYSVGCLDAEKGEPCEPLVHYAKLGDIEQYICGWQDATEAINAALDLREDMADREYWRQGGW